VTVIGEQPSTELMMVRPLTAAGEAARSLRQDELLYWRGDLF